MPELLAGELASNTLTAKTTPEVTLVTRPTEVGLTIPSPVTNAKLAVKPDKLTDAQIKVELRHGANWRSVAHCLNLPDFVGMPPQKAKSYCVTCPVTIKCINEGFDYGRDASRIRGGLEPSELRKEYRDIADKRKTAKALEQAALAEAVKERQRIKAAEAAVMRLHSEQ